MSKYQIYFSPHFLKNSERVEKELELGLEAPTVEDLVNKCLELEYLSSDLSYVLIINDVEVEDVEKTISPEDFILFKVRPNKKLKKVLRVILPFVLSAGLGRVFGQFLFGAKSSMAFDKLSWFQKGISNLLGAWGAALITNKLVPPPQQDIGGRGDQSKDTPLYTVTSTQNQLNPYGPIPIILGRVRIYPPYASRPYTEVAGKDQYVFGVLAAGYVEDGDDNRILVSDIRIGETGIENFQGVSVNSTTSVQRMDANSKAKYNANVDEEGLEILLSSANSWQTRTTAADTDFFSFDIAAPSGMIRYDNSGNKFPVTVNFEAEYKPTSVSIWSKMDLKRLTEVFQDSYVDFSGTASYIGSFLGVSGFNKASASMYPSDTYPLKPFTDNFESDLRKYNFGLRSIYDPNTNFLVLPSKNLHFTNSNGIYSEDYIRTWNFKLTNSNNFPQVSFSGSYLSQFLVNGSDEVQSANNVCYFHRIVTGSEAGPVQTLVAKNISGTRTAWLLNINPSTGAITVATFGAAAFLPDAAFEFSDFFSSGVDNETPSLAFYVGFLHSVACAYNGTNHLLYIYEGWEDSPTANFGHLSSVASGAVLNVSSNARLVDNHSIVISYDSTSTLNLFTYVYELNIRDSITCYKHIFDLSTGVATLQPGAQIIKGFKNSTKERFFIHPRNIKPDGVIPTAASYVCKEVFITVTDVDTSSPTYGQSKVLRHNILSGEIIQLGSPPNGEQFDFIYNTALHPTEPYIAFVPERAVYQDYTDPRGQVWGSNVIDYDEENKDGVTYNLSAKNSQSVRWSFFADPPGADQYDIRIRRTTPDTSDDKIRDEIYWTTLRSYQAGSAIVTPNVKTLAFRIKATEQLSGQVNSLNCIVSSVLRIWDGSSFSYAETNNPAWAFAYVLTSKANKRPIADSKVNWTRLKEWADFCDDKGFTFNAVIDNYTTQHQLLTDIAAAGRASYDIIDGLHTVVIDKEQTTPIQLITPRNSWDFSSERSYPERPHAIRISFRNEDKDYDRDERIVYDDGYNSSNASIFETMDLWGITNADHVFKMGRYYLAVAQLRPETFKVTTDIENIVLTKGDMFLYQDDVISWGIGTTRIKNLREDSGFKIIEFEGTFDLDITETYAVRVRNEEMNLYAIEVQPYTYESAAGDVRVTTEVKISDGTGFYSSFQIGNLLTIGEITPGEAVPCIVTEINYGDDLTAQITFTEYAEAVFDADTVSIPEFDSKITGTLDARRGEPPQPEIIEILSDESALYTSGSGTLIPSILIKFKKEQTGNLNSPTGVRALWRDKEDASGPWNIATFELDSEFQIRLTDVEQGREYWGKFQYITKAGVAGRYNYDTAYGPLGFNYESPHTVIGRSNPPANVSNFSAGFREYAVQLTWDANTEPDLSGYLIRLEGSGWSQRSDLLIQRSYTVSQQNLTLGKSLDACYITQGSAKNTLALGLPSTDTTNSRYSRVLIYSFSTRYGRYTYNRWVLSEELPNPTYISSQYGYDVSLSHGGDYLAVSAPGDLFYSSALTSWTQGVIRVYTRGFYNKFFNSGLPITFATQESVLQNLESAGDNPIGYGQSVAISGDGLTLAVGIPYYETSSTSAIGAVAIYKRATVTTYTWTFSELLFSDSPAEDERFGTSVSLNGDGDVICIGAAGNNSDEGAFYVFDRTGTDTWSKRGSTFTETDASAGDLFGTSIKLNEAGDELVVGSVGFTTNTGRVYYYSENGTGWDKEVEIENPRSTINQNFGQSVTFYETSTPPIIMAGSPEIGDIHSFQNSTWANGTAVADTDTTFYIDDVKQTGTINYYIKAVDDSGIESVTEQLASITIEAPESPTIEHNFDNLGNAILQWSANQGSFPISQYEIRVGTTSDTWETADLLLFTKAEKYSERVNYGGTKRYFFKTIDAAGNYSSVATYEDVVITDPPAVTELSAQAIKSQVILTWDFSQGSLPVRTFKVYKGSSVGSGTLISTVDATISQITETIPSSPTYTYWVVAIDTAGNVSTGSSIDVAVSPQNDYIFTGAVTSDMRYPDSKTNYWITTLGDGTKVGLPMFDETETWAEHFNTRGYNTIQDIIDDGFTYYLEPADQDSNYVETVDMLNGAPSNSVIVNGLVQLDNSPTGYSKVVVDQAIQELVTLRAGEIDSFTGYGYEQGFAWRRWGNNYEFDFDDAEAWNLVRGDYIRVNLTTSPDSNMVLRVLDVIDNSTYATVQTTKESLSANITFDGSPDQIGGLPTGPTGKYQFERVAIVWTVTATNQYNVYATNFRFIQVEYDWVNPPNTGDTLVYYRGFKLTTSAEPLDDGGVADILGSDVGGTAIPYNVDFLQVQSVTANAVDTSQPYFITVDFDTSELNPASFDAYAWNTDGNRVSIQIAWRARGV